MKMKFSKSFIVTVAAILIAAGILWNYWNELAHSPRYPQEIVPGSSWQPRLQKTNNRAPPPHSSNHVSHNLGFRQRASEMSEAERAVMTNLFVTKLKPAVEKWAAVYGSRVPFNLADLTMDKFVERIGHDGSTYHSYTFVMGDITLGVAEQSGGTQVQYLASKQALRSMEAVPQTGAAPDLSMPVTPKDVLAMAEADSGQQLPPNLVQLIPSAESGSLAGGAIVNVGSEVKNAVGIPVSNVSAGISYVFAKSGTLAYYLRTH